MPVNTRPGAVADVSQHVRLVPGHRPDGDTRSAIPARPGTRLGRCRPGRCRTRCGPVLAHERVLTDAEQPGRRRRRDHRCLQPTLRWSQKTSNEFLEMFIQGWPGSSWVSSLTMYGAAGPPDPGVCAWLAPLASRSPAWADAVPVRFVMPRAGRDVAHPRAGVRPALPGLGPQARRGRIAGLGPRAGHWGRPASPSAAAPTRLPNRRWSVSAVRQHRLGLDQPIWDVKFLGLWLASC
jgi:hypothetical protein